MTRTDRNRLLTLCLTAGPLLFTACTRSASEPPESASVKAEPITVRELPEVVVTAPRIHSDEQVAEEERRVVARADR